MLQSYCRLTFCYSFLVRRSFSFYLDTGLERILSKFAHDPELGGTVDSLAGKEALQGDLEKLKR